MPSNRLTELSHALRDAFSQSSDRHKAHQAAQKILTDAAPDQTFRDAVISRCLDDPSFLLQRRINPVIALPVCECESYTLVANVWFPLPDLSTEQSHQSIHHHGSLLLTSVAGFGPGYESILFKKGFELNRETRITRMAIDRIYQNSLGNHEFVDSFTPHVVFYPKELSLTFALWSPERERFSSGLKGMRLFKKSKSLLKKGIEALHLSSVFGLNQSVDLDFYPKDGRIHCLGDRVMYPVGSNGNFQQNFFHLVQTLKYSDINRLKSATNRISDQGISCSAWLKMLEAGERIEAKFESIHLRIPKVNLNREDILSCFRAVAS